MVLQSIRDWRWMQWTLLLLVVVLLVIEVVERQLARNATLSASNLQQIEFRIVESRSMAERLVHSERLPIVKQQWQYVQAITSHYGVALQKDAGSNSKGAYRGPLDAWGGTLQGSVGAVLVTAQRIQETVPAFLYQFTVANGQMTLAFSVLGSNPNEKD